MPAAQQPAPTRGRVRARRSFAAALLGAIALAALLAASVAEVPQRGRPPQRPAAKKAVPPASAGLSLIFTGELDSFMQPCGCSSPMIGGIARRAAWLRKLPAATSVRVENGDLVDGVGRQDELKAETIADVLGTLSYDAVALGEDDWALGTDFLRSLQQRVRGNLLCANVVSADGQPVFKPYIVVRKTVNGRTARVLIAGVLAEEYASQVSAREPALRVQPAEDALKAVDTGTANAADVRVLLFHGGRPQAEQLARRFPSYGLVVYAHAGDRPGEPLRVGKTTLVCGGSEGRYVGRADLAAAAGWPVQKVAYTALLETMPEDAAVEQMRKAYIQRVVAEDLLGKVARLPTANGDTFAGSAECTSCHAQAHNVWQSSRHAHALDSLAKVGEDRDPECVRCHVVGLEQVSGFTTREQTPGLANVGCESCHGPAAAHARAPSTAKPPRGGIEVCQTCHTAQQSLHFDFATYWAKIRH